MKLSSKIHIPPSATIAMNALAASKKKQGEVVYNLTVGEPMIETPEIIQNAAIEALRQGKTFYTPPAGIPELRETAALWINTQFGSKFQKENTIVTCGGKHGLLMIFQALLEPGDEVLIPAPYWVSYPSMVELFFGVPKIIQSDESRGWKCRPEDIESMCNEKTKILILNNGGNPSGVLYTREEFSALLKMAREKGLIVVSDEVYSGLVYDNAEFVSAAEFPEYVENTILVQSCSKHFAMTGWRVGFVFAPKDLIAMLETLQSQSTTGTSSISQWAALAAIQNANEVIPKINQEMQLRRDAFVQNFQKYFGVVLPPAEAGLYFFISLKDFGLEETDSLAWSLKVLQEANVVFVPGAPFGVDGYVRASFGGKMADVEAGLQKLSEYLQSQK